MHPAPVPNNVRYAPIATKFDLLFRWFVGLGVDDPVWDHSTFSKNRDRLLEGEITAKLCYMGHALMENRHGLAVGDGVSVSQATGLAERDKALELIDGLDRRRRRITLGADKAYDATQFVYDLRGRSVTPHIAIDGHLSKTGKRRKTAVDGRTSRHAGYDISQRCRKRIEEVFGRIKSSAGLAKVKLRGRDRVDAAFTLALAAYNLIRLPKLLEAAA